MENDAIFLLSENGVLERVESQKYSAESILQALIADHPDLLSGDQMSPGDPPRWLLIAPQAGVPDAAESSDRWSIDHLLLDHNGRPTIIEFKRSTDTRIRREVIGQVLEYAANATAYWPVDRIRTLASELYGSTDKLNEEIGKLLGLPDGEEQTIDIEAYWKRVEENLRVGELRLLFVADELPRELRRVIEFLNEQMPRIEVLGIEVRQFVGKNIRALAPRLIGQTERALQGKTPTSRSTANPAPVAKTTRAVFIEASPAWIRDFFQELISAAPIEGFRIVWNSKSFNVCRKMSDGRFRGFMTSYLPGTFGLPTPFIDVDQRSFDDPARVRSELSQMPVFKPHGKYFFRVVLDESNLTPVREPLERVRKMAGGLPVINR